VSKEVYYYEVNLQMFFKPISAGAGGNVSPLVSESVLSIEEK
jgi:hypothetical protein